MQSGSTRSQNHRGRARRRAGPLRAVSAIIFLALGASLAWLGQLSLNLGRSWADDQSLGRWGEALAHFRSGQQPARASGWERHLLRVGPSVLIAIGGTLVVLWTLLLLGGVLVWLAARGYGFYILLATVAIGTILGSWMALLHGHDSQHDRLN